MRLRENQAAMAVKAFSLFLLCLLTQCGREQNQSTHKSPFQSLATHNGEKRSLLFSVQVRQETSNATAYCIFQLDSPSGDPEQLTPKGPLQERELRQILKSDSYWVDVLGIGAATFGLSIFSAPFIDSFTNYKVDFVILTLVTAFMTSLQTGYESYSRAKKARMIQTPDVVELHLEDYLDIKMSLQNSSSQSFFEISCKEVWETHEPMWRTVYRKHFGLQL